MPREYQRKTIGKLMTAIQHVKAGDSVYNVSKSSEFLMGHYAEEPKIQRNDKRIESGRGFFLTLRKKF